MKIHNLSRMQNVTTTLRLCPKSCVFMPELQFLRGKLVRFTAKYIKINEDNILACRCMSFK